MLADINTVLPQDTTVDELATAPFTFYLSGSHYFGCARPDSDIDFMVQDSPEARAWLQGNGFDRDILGDYGRGILSKEVRERGNVQVQVCVDVDTKRRVRDAIKAHQAEYHRTADRETRMLLWNSWARVLAPEKYLWATEGTF